MKAIIRVSKALEIPVPVVELQHESQEDLDLLQSFQTAGLIRFDPVRGWRFRLVAPFPND